MAGEVLADHASMRAAADAIERIPSDCGVTSLWLDYDGDFGHEGLESETGSFLARWQARLVVAAAGAVLVAATLVSDLGATDVPPAAGSLAPGEGDTCWYRSQTYSFPELLGVESPMDELRDVVAGALENHDGWELRDEEESPGGFVGVDAEGPGDASLELRTRSGTELRIVALVDGACQREELPLP